MPWIHHPTIAPFNRGRTGGSYSVNLGSLLYFINRTGQSSVQRLRGIDFFLPSDTSENIGEWNANRFPGAKELSVACPRIVLWALATWCDCS